MKQGGTTVGDRLEWAYGQALSRTIQPAESEVLTEVYRKHLAQYTADPDAARQLVTTGESPMPTNVDVAELAAWTSVTRIILNQHETITRN